MKTQGAVRSGRVHPSSLKVVPSNEANTISVP